MKDEGSNSNKKLAKVREGNEEQVGEDQVPEGSLVSVWRYRQFGQSGNIGDFS